MPKCRGNFKNIRASEQGNLSHMSTTSIENIKQACMKHFGLSIDGLLCCDVLAGEQVPFCSSVKRLADTRSSTCGLWKDQITSSSQKLN